MIHRKPIEAFDAEGRLIGKWPSVLGAATENDGIPGCSKQVIKNCASCTCREQCRFCAYFRKYKVIWRYA